MLTAAPHADCSTTGGLQHHMLPLWHCAAEALLRSAWRSPDPKPCAPARQGSKQACGTTKVALSTGCATQSTHGLCPCHTPLVHGGPEVGGLCRRLRISSSALRSPSAVWCLSQHALEALLHTHELHWAPLATSMLGSKERHERQHASAVG